MKIITTFLLAFSALAIILASLATAASSEDPDMQTLPPPALPVVPTVSTMNRLIDQIVSALKAYQLLDPLALPQYHILLRRKVGTVQSNGHALLANTTITGLSEVHRRGDTKNITSNTSTGNSTSFSVHLHMGRGNVKVASTSAVHFSDSTYPNLKVAADIVDIAIHFTVTLGGGGGDGSGSGISDFTVDAFHFASFKVDGLPAGDPVVGGLSQSYQSILNKKGRTMLTESIRPLLEQELKNFSADEEEREATSASSL
ncbi:hypothetical protein TYRP_003785 [Tyrophagus putrescentiae]|nr:hypothetical protein TYRP_003785 [Tyrophagus putrescentiae]